MGRASRTKRDRRGPRPLAVIADEPDTGTWVRHSVCKACGKPGRVSLAEGNCVENMDACLRRVERKRARAQR